MLETYFKPSDAQTQVINDIKQYAIDKVLANLRYDVQLNLWTHTWK